MIDKPLNLDAVRAFVHIARLGSFTGAAEATETTQAAVSLKLKRLEQLLDCRLVERTPRHVQLSTQGSAFLPHAIELLKAHDRACNALGETRERLKLGISDHVAGPELPALISRMNQHSPNLVIEIHLGTSSDLLLRYDRREFDAVIVRFDTNRDDGQIIASERFGWFAAEGWQHKDGEPIPIATMPDPCGVRRMAEKHLEDAGIEFTEVFSGGGVAAVSAAVMARMGVAALAHRMLPLGAVEVGTRLGLPKLPKLPIILHSRIEGGHSAGAITELSAALKNAALR